MKKISTILLGLCLSLLCHSQQKTVSSQTSVDTTTEKTDSFLGMIGALSAAYLISTQEHIDALVILHDNKTKTVEDISGKLTSHKNILDVLLKQADRINETKALTPENSDYYFLSDFRETLVMLSGEIELYAAYLKTGEATKKTSFETSREGTKKKIRVLLGIDD